MKPSLLFSLLCLTVASCAPTVSASIPTLLPSSSPTPIVQVAATKPTQVTVCTGVTGGKLNVRANANAQAPVLGVLDEGEAVELSPTLASNAGWLAIQNPFSGWVKARFLCGVSQ